MLRLSSVLLASLVLLASCRDSSGPAPAATPGQLALVRALVDTLPDDSYSVQYVVVVPAARGERAYSLGTLRYEHGLRWRGREHLVLFAARPDGAVGLYELSLRTGVVRQLDVGLNGLPPGPVASPDRRRLLTTEVLLDSLGWRTTLRMHEAGQVTVLWSHAQATYSPLHPCLEWVPDGERVVFSVDSSLYVVPAAGGEARRLATIHGGFYDACSWSPDGARLVVSTMGGGARPSLSVIAIDGAAPVMLDTTRYRGFPSWSPDGTRIATALNRDAGVSTLIEVWGPNGARRELTFNGRTDAIAWAPDGAAVLVLGWHNLPDRARQGIFRVPLDGGAVVDVANPHGTDVSGNIAFAVFRP